VPSSSNTPKHRAAPAPSRPAAFTGPRHAGHRSSRPAHKALRATVTMTGLAAAVTGAAVAAGVVQTPSAPVNLAGSFTPAASAHPPTVRVHGEGARALAGNNVADKRAAELHDRAPVVSRSSDRLQADHRQAEDPAKAAALGLSAGPAVSGREDLSDQDPQ